ncbi:hypothetical protein QUC31_006373 [Theobroma cacao]
MSSQHFPHASSYISDCHSNIEDDKTLFIDLILVYDGETNSCLFGTIRGQ